MAITINFNVVNLIVNLSDEVIRHLVQSKLVWEMFAKQLTAFGELHVLKNVGVTENITLHIYIGLDEVLLKLT